MDTLQSSELKNKRKLGMAGVGLWVLALGSVIGYFFYKNKH